MLSRILRVRGGRFLKRGGWTRNFSGEVQTVAVPQMGDSITEGLLSEYVKNVGDPVNVDDVLVIIETDKVAVDVRSEVSGTVVKYHFEEGEDVEVGANLVDIEIGEGYEVVDTPPSNEGESTIENVTSTESAPVSPVSEKKYADRFEAMRHNHHRKPLIKFTHGKRDPEPQQAQNIPQETTTVFHTDLGLGAAMYGRPLLSEAEVDAINNGGMEL